MASEKLLFLHIPKTAGTSFRALFDREYPGSRQLPLYYPTPYKPELLTELRARVPTTDAFIGHVFFGIDADLGFQARYMTFLRHPVDRVVSYFLHNKRNPDSPYHGWIRDGVSLHHMLEHERIPELNNNMTRMIAGLHDNDLLESRSVLDTAIANLEERFLFVGITEDFDKCIQLLGARLGWRQVLTTPVLNRSPKHLREQLDAPTLAAIEKYNQLDLELYQYGKTRLNNELADIPAKQNAVGLSLLVRVGHQIRQRLWRR